MSASTDNGAPGLRAYDDRDEGAEHAAVPTRLVVSTDLRRYLAEIKGQASDPGFSLEQMVIEVSGRRGRGR